MGLEPASDPREQAPAVGSIGGFAVSQLDDALRDALTRLVMLLGTPAEIPVLAPPVRREIFYRLLAGPQGPMLRHLAVAGGPAQRIAAGLDWLRRRALVPVRRADLAREVG